MIKPLNISDIHLYVKDEKYRNSLNTFHSKKSSNKLYLINNKAVFAISLTGNNYYNVMIHLLDVKSINSILKEIKTSLNSLILIILRNDNIAKIYESIEPNLIIHSLNFWYIKKDIEDVKINSNYIIEKSKTNKKLETFFVECFKDEWDEKVEKWFKDYNNYKGEKEILILKHKNQIASSVMFWIYDNSIYIFLLGTSPKYRRKKLAQYILKKVQEKYPKKFIDLTVYSNSDAQIFYKNLGFKKDRIANVFI